MDETRRQKIERIRREIAAGTYDQVLAGIR